MVQQLIGGWELAGIVTARPGQAFSPSVSGDPMNTGAGTRPDLMGQVILPNKVNCFAGGGHLGRLSSLGAGGPAAGDPLSPSAANRIPTTARNPLPYAGRVTP